MGEEPEPSQDPVESSTQSGRRRSTARAVIETLNEIAASGNEWVAQGAFGGGIVGALVGFLLALLGVWIRRGTVRGPVLNEIVLAVFGTILLPIAGIFLGVIVGGALGGIVCIIRACRKRSPTS